MKVYATFIFPADLTDHFGQLMTQYTFFKVLGAFTQCQILSQDICFIDFSFFYQYFNPNSTFLFLFAV